MIILDITKNRVISIRITVTKFILLDSLRTVKLNKFPGVVASSPPGVFSLHVILSVVWEVRITRIETYSYLCISLYVFSYHSLLLPRVFL